MAAVLRHTAQLIVLPAAFFTAVQSQSDARAAELDAGSMVDGGSDQDVASDAESLSDVGSTTQIKP
jgi:hypothetical protein